MAKLEEDLANVLGSLGFWGLMILALVFGLTFLVKWPLKKWAVRWAEENKSDKKVITRWFFLIPIVLSFILSLIFLLWREWGWDVTAIVWKEVASSTISYAVAPAALYEWADNFRKSDEAVARLNYALGKDATPAQIQEARKAAKAKAKADKQALKEAKAKAKEQEKAAEELKAKQQRKEELEKELAALNAQPNTVAEATAKVKVL